MSIKFTKEDDESYENAILCDGLPSQWEIVKETGENIFRIDMLPHPCPIYKEDARQTEDISQEDNLHEVKIDEYPIQMGFGMQFQLCSNPCSVQEQIQIQKEIQAPKCTEIIKKCQIKRKKQTGKSKKRKSIAKLSKSKQEFLSETKNIPKNYGKQIIKFIKSQKELAKKVLLQYNSKFSYEKLMEQLKKKKKSLNKIADLRKLWLSYDYSKQVRILTGVFLKKFSLSWIFNSRIQNTKFPVKYRYRIIEGVQKPEEFIYLKDF